MESSCIIAKFLFLEGRCALGHASARKKYGFGGLNSQRDRGELNSQRELDSGGLPCFSATMLLLWQHCYNLFISLCMH